MCENGQKVGLQNGPKMDQISTKKAGLTINNVTKNNFLVILEFPTKLFQVQTVYSLIHSTDFHEHLPNMSIYVLLGRQIITSKLHSKASV